METNFEKLMATKHMLDWFSEEPFEQITATVERMFNKQAPNTKLLYFEVTSEPQWITGGKKTDDDKIILVRSGVAFTFDFTLKNDTDTYDMNAVFTWIGANLDSNPSTNMWVDLDGTLDEFGENGLLTERIYALD
jgi:hypothetical protein